MVPTPTAAHAKRSARDCGHGLQPFPLRTDGLVLRRLLQQRLAPPSDQQFVLNYVESGNHIGSHFDGSIPDPGATVGPSRAGPAVGHQLHDRLVVSTPPGSDFRSPRWLRQVRGSGHMPGPTGQPAKRPGFSGYTIGAPTGGGALKGWSSEPHRTGYGLSVWT